MFRIILAILVAIASVPVYFLYIRSPPAVPEIDLEEYWGSALSKSNQDDSIKPFKIDFSDELIKDLKARLRDRHPLAAPLEGVAFEYGFNTKALDTWIKYWAEEYPFKERQQFLNKYPHFKTNIQGLNIHFMRVTPEVPPGVELVPLLMGHGWPGSVREFYEAIPHLTAVSKDRNFALELIIPSLPGYGFSSAPVRPGMGPDKIAVILRNLMHRLGYKKYYAQGANWGGYSLSILATMFPDEVLGYHTNSPFTFSSAFSSISFIGSIYPPLVVSSDVQDRVYPLSAIYSNMVLEGGYGHIQSTKPDTIGIVLSDSPIGLAAYLLEKFSTWTNMDNRKKPDGGLTESYDRNQLLDNIMIYWASNSITTAIRIYAETFNKKFFSFLYDDIPTPVPTIVMQVRNELSYTPIPAIRLKYPNLLNETSPNEGGAFIALESPEMFSKDVLNAVHSFREWHRNKKTEL